MPLKYLPNTGWKSQDLQRQYAAVGQSSLRCRIRSFGNRGVCVAFPNGCRATLAVCVRGMAWQCSKALAPDNFAHDSR